MSFLLETFVGSVLIPACGAVAVMLLWRWRAPQPISRRHAAAWAVGCGFLLAYLFLPSAPLAPTSHWHWLPYLGLAAMIVAPVGLAEGVRRPERWGLELVIALLAAWFLVPDWSTIQPQRGLYLAVTAGMLFLLGMTWDWVMDRVASPTSAMLVSLAALAGAVVLIQSGSMKFAYLGGAVSAVNLACGLVMAFSRWKPLFQSAVSDVTVLLGGLMLAGYLNSFSQVPLASYLLVPLAPLGLGVGLWRGLRDWSGPRQLTAQTVAVLVPLILSVALALLAEPIW